MKDKTSINIEKNSDSYVIGPAHNPLRRACIEESVEDVPRLALIPTEAELIELVRYWAAVVLNYTYFYFQRGRIDSGAWRSYRFALSRLNHVFDSLNFADDSLMELIGEVHTTFKAKHKISDETWKIFINGNEEEWNNFRKPDDDDIPF